MLNADAAKLKEPKKVTIMEAFPLHWPLGRKKTEKYQRTHSAFKTTLARARDGVIKQLDMMWAKDIVISSNVDTYSKFKLKRKFLRWKVTEMKRGFMMVLKLKRMKK